MTCPIPMTDYACRRPLPLARWFGLPSVLFILTPWPCAVFARRTNATTANFCRRTPQRGGGHFSRMAERAPSALFKPFLVPGPLAGRFHMRRLTMADYFTHFSCLLDVDSAANALSAQRLSTELRLEDVGLDEPLCSGFELTLQEGEAPHILWIHDDASGDVEQVIGFVLRLAHEYDLKGLWGFD